MTTADDESTLRVVIADDQRVVREGLATIVGSLPGTEVVGVAADGHEAVALARELAPDVVLMDLRMPRMDGASATALIRSQLPQVQVVVLTTYADDQSVIDAMASGATGYLTKDAGRDDIHRALVAAGAGQAVLDAAAQAALVEAAKAGAAARPPTGGAPGIAAGEARGWTGPGAAGAASPAGARARALPDGLTEREGEVLSLVGAGLSNGEIAKRLYVSEATVKSHINRIFAKTGSRDRAQAATYAYRHGLTG